MLTKMIRLTVSVDSKLKDFISDFLLGLDAQGVSEEKPDEKMVNITALFTQYTDTDNIIEKLCEFGKILKDKESGQTPFEITVDHVDRSYWEVWRSFLKTIRVSPRIIIYPPWEPPEIKNGDIALEINPSMAFGTGHHETTRLCLRSIEQICEENDIESLIDIGCGSGVLGIAAARMGISNIIAMDNDLLAVKETLSNMSVNGVSEKFIYFCGTPDNLSGVRADIVVANITTGPILKMKSNLRTIMKDKGYLVLSGIPLTGKEEILSGIKTEGFKLEDIKAEGDWIALIFRQ